jgi:hypothetical protein
LIKIKARPAALLFITAKYLQEGTVSALVPHWRRPGLVAALSQWRCPRQDPPKLSRLEPCDPDEAGQTAQEAGVSLKDLRMLTCHGPNIADLLLRRMAALHLDPVELACMENVMFRDLQRLCVMCKSKGRCVRDLDNRTDPAWEEWRDYCPNASTLSMLSAVEASRDHRA